MAKMAVPLTREQRAAGATVVAEVIGALPICDAVTRESVEAGGTVRLDPTRTNIAALVEGGSIKVLPAAPEKAEKGKV